MDVGHGSGPSCDRPQHCGPWWFTMQSRFFRPIRLRVSNKTWNASVCYDRRHRPLRRALRRWAPYVRKQFIREASRVATKLLKKGASGTDVKNLQKALNAAGAKPKLQEDGKFGSGSV